MNTSLWLVFILLHSSTNPPSLVYWSRQDGQVGQVDYPSTQSSTFQLAGWSGDRVLDLLDLYQIIYLTWMIL